MVIGGAILWDEDGGYPSWRAAAANVVFDAVKAPLDAAARELKVPFSLVKMVKAPKVF